MTNEQLQKILPRFPGEAEIQIVYRDAVCSIDHVEFLIPDGAIAVGDANVAWADMVRAQLRLRLVALAPVMPPDIGELAERMMKRTEP